MVSPTEPKPIVFDESKIHWSRPMPDRLNYLTREQLQFYRDNGYVLVKRMFTKAESAMYRQECHELADRLSKHTNIDATWGAARDTVAAAKRTVVQHCHDVQFYSAAFS